MAKDRRDELRELFDKFIQDNNLSVTDILMISDLITYDWRRKLQETKEAEARRVKKGG